MQTLAIAQRVLADVITEIMLSISDCILGLWGTPPLPLNDDNAVMCLLDTSVPSGRVF